MCDKYFEENFIQNISTLCKFLIREVFLQWQRIQFQKLKKLLTDLRWKAASEVGVNLKQGYNGDLTSKQAGSVGGQMVKKMIKAYEESMK